MPFLGVAGNDGGSGWLGAGKALAAIAGVVIIGRFLTRPLMRLIAKADVREIFTAFALLLVIGIAQLMAAAGLSMALGAFLAGVLLASSEYLEHAFKTVEYRIKVTINKHGRWKYDEDIVLKIRGRTKLFHHTDRSTLTRIGAPIPNPMARRRKSWGAVRRPGRRSPRSTPIQRQS